MRCVFVLPQLKARKRDDYRNADIRSPEFLIWYFFPLVIDRLEVIPSTLLDFTQEETSCGSLRLATQFSEGWVRGERELFTKTVEAVIAEERSKSHHILADSLTHAASRASGQSLPFKSYRKAPLPNCS